MKRTSSVLCILAGLLVLTIPVMASPTLPHAHTLPAALSADPPAAPVKLIFIHHSTGGNWLADPNNDQPYGGLGQTLMGNNYFVSATNYGWGPDGIGDRTDIPNWPEWFLGPNLTQSCARCTPKAGRTSAISATGRACPTIPAARM